MKNKTFILDNLKIIDTETTSVDKDESEIIELAVLGDKIEFQSLYKPTKPILPEISCINNISNKMVENKPVFNSDMIKGIFSESDIICGHNVSFDIFMLSKYGINLSNNILCTYKLAKKVFLTVDQEALSRYDLQYLRYALDIDLDAEHAHRAISDCRVCKCILEISLEIFESVTNIDPESPNYLDELYYFMSKPIKLKAMPFGKYKGQPFSDIPNSYISWLIDNTDRLDESSDSFDQDLYHTIIDIYG